MDKIKLISLTASMVLAMAFTLSCSGDDGGGGGNSSSGGNQSSSSAGANGPSSSGGGDGNSQSYGYCLFSEHEICLDGPFTSKDCNSVGGKPSNNCPYGGPSSSGGGSSSSGGGEENPQSYGYCLFSEHEICLDGSFTSKDCNSIGGSPSNNCPYGGSSSSEGGVEPSSNSEDGESSSSEGDVEPSSSSSSQSEGVGCIINSTCVEVQSEELCNMLSGVSIPFCPAKESSSSSVEPGSSSSNSVPVTLACAVVQTSGNATVPITPPALTCSNGETASGISWLGSPAIDWNNPKGGTYSDISVKANCGTATDLNAGCHGTLTVQPAVSCSMAKTGFEGIAIALPVVTCSDGYAPFEIVFGGSMPNWDSPEIGNYEVSARVDCGFGTILPVTSCGTLKVTAATLTCGTVPTSGFSGTAITPPALTCSNKETATNITWSGAPNWSNPAIGTYSNIKATAACGTSSGLTANCSGTLTVNTPPALACTMTATTGRVGVQISPAPSVTCNGTAVSSSLLTWTPANLTPTAAGSAAVSASVGGTGVCKGMTAACGNITVSPPTLACTMTATTGRVGVQISPSPSVTCNGTAVSSSLLTWAPANLTPTAAGSVAVSASVGGTGVCSGMAAACGNVQVYPACPVSSSSNGSITCGGQTYKTVTIGTQTWMAENLNYNANGSKCYNNLDSNCDTYGRLYNWEAAMTACPPGWHLPTQAEWNTLSSYVQSYSGCSSCDAKLLKATSGWNSNGNGTDTYGFSALPGGYSDGSFLHVGSSGLWWSASEINSISAYFRVMTYDDDALWNSNLKSNLFSSVRCLQD